MTAPVVVTRPGRKIPPGSMATIGVLIVVAVAALKVGAPLLVPIALALLISQLLSPVVRFLANLRIPVAAGAALAVFGATTIVIGGVVMLGSPAASWLARAPETFTSVEGKVRRLVRPLQSLERAAQKVERATAAGAAPPQAVQVAKPTLVQRISGGTVSFIGTALSVIFLAYFLLANAPLFRRKLANVMPRRLERAKVEEALAEIEVHMSRYLLLNAAVCVVVGAVTAAWLKIVGMPNAGLWGVLAGVLNFVPYIGAVITLGIIALASMASFEGMQQPLMAIGGFAVVNLLEGNLLTPMLLGRKLPLNAVAIFVGFLFWGWVWGWTGAFLAVPMTVLIKIVCDRVEALKSFGLFLDS